MTIIVALLIYWLLLVLISKVYSSLQSNFLQKFPEKLPKLVKYLLPGILILLFILQNQAFQYFQQKNTQKIFGETKILKQKGVPVLWSDNYNVLVFKDRLIFKYDLKNNKRGDLIFKITDKNNSLFLDNSCFNKDRLFLTFKRRNPEHPAWVESTFEIIDMNQQYKVEILDTKYYIYPDFKCNKPGKKVYLPDQSKPSYNGLYYAYDESKSMYFQYMDERDFDKSYYSPRKGWWVDIEQKVISGIVIPAGPWVTDYSFYDDLQYFSCGRSCYSNMKIYVSNGEIYAHIYGRAILNGAEGVYHLILGEGGKSNQWQKIASGTLDYKPLLSKDGCKVLYSVDEEMKITNICKKV